MHINVRKAKVSLVPVRYMEDCQMLIYMNKEKRRQKQKKNHSQENVWVFPNLARMTMTETLKNYSLLTCILIIPSKRDYSKWNFHILLYLVLA